MIGDREHHIRARLGEIGGEEPAGPERELLARLLTSYTSKTLAGVDRLAELIRGGDVAAVRDQAHALKGSASNLGVVTLAGLFAQLESAARDGRMPDPETDLTAVREEYELVEPVCRDIAAELAKKPAPSGR